jgi:hypothetical protein
MSITFYVTTSYAHNFLRNTHVEPTGYRIARGKAGKRSDRGASERSARGVAELVFGIARIWTSDPGASIGPICSVRWQIRPPRDATQINSFPVFTPRQYTVSHVHTTAHPFLCSHCTWTRVHTATPLVES